MIYFFFVVFLNIMLNLFIFDKKKEIEDYEDLFELINILYSKF